MSLSGREVSLQAQYNFYTNYETEPELRVCFQWYQRQIWYLVCGSESFSGIRSFLCLLLNIDTRNERTKSTCQVSVLVGNFTVVNWCIWNCWCCHNSNQMINYALTWFPQILKKSETALRPQIYKRWLNTEDCLKEAAILVVFLRG